MLANHVRTRRTELRLTQEALAIRAHTTRQTVIAIEKGRTPTVPMMLRLAEALEVEPQALFFSPASNTDIPSQTNSRGLKGATP